VTRKGAYGGLWSDMKGVSLAEFDSLIMSVKVVSGPPKFLIGLKPRGGEEVKIAAAAHVGPADSAGWRDVTIPLAAFRGTLGLSAMETFSIAFTNAVTGSKGELLIREVSFASNQNHVIVDEFERPAISTNLLGQKNWTFSHGAAAVSVDMDSSRATAPGKQCLRISYGGSVGLDLGGGDFSYSAWVAGLGGVDVSRAVYLRMRVKGQNGGEKPNIYLDDGTRRRHIDLEKIEPVTTAWHEFRIPLEEFARQGVDLTHAEQLQIVFEWEAMSGTIYVDDIEFGTESALVAGGAR
jgi:hypothetical protein